MGTRGINVSVHTVVVVVVVVVVAVENVLFTV